MSFYEVDRIINRELKDLMVQMIKKTSFVRFLVSRKQNVKRPRPAEPRIHTYYVSEYLNTIWLS